MCVWGGGGGGGGGRDRGGVVDTNDWCTTILPEVSIANFLFVQVKIPTNYVSSF